MRLLTRRKSHDFISFPHHTGSYLPAEPTEVEVRAQHVLHRITEIRHVAVGMNRYGLQKVQQAGAFIPRRTLRLLYHIVAIQSGKGKTGHILYT